MKNNNIRVFRKSTLEKVNSKTLSEKDAKYSVLVGKSAVAYAKSIKDAKYIRKNLRRFFKRILETSPRIALKKVS